jgi:hypothetical protein
MVRVNQERFLKDLRGKLRRFFTPEDVRTIEEALVAALLREQMIHNAPGIVMRTVSAHYIVQSDGTSTPVKHGEPTRGELLKMVAAGAHAVYLYKE